MAIMVAVSVSVLPACSSELASSDPTNEILKPSSLPDFKKAKHTNTYSIKKFGGADFTAVFNLYGYDYVNETAYYEYRAGLMRDLWATMSLDGTDSMLFHLMYDPNKPDPELAYAENTKIYSKAYTVVTNDKKEIIHYECSSVFPRSDYVYRHLKWEDIVKITESEANAWFQTQDNLYIDLASLIPPSEYAIYVNGTGYIKINQNDVCLRVPNKCEKVVKNYASSVDAVRFMQCVKNMEIASKQMNDNFLLSLLFALMGCALLFVSKGSCLFVRGVGAGFAATYVKDGLRGNYYAAIANKCFDNIS